MMLRQRIVVTGLVVAVPVTAALTWAVERVRARDREEAVTRVVQSQINEQVRERCESDPAWFFTGPLEGRPPGGVFVERFPDELPPRPRAEPQPFELFAYDDRFAGSSPVAPRLPEELRRALRSSPTGTPVVAPHVTEAGTGAQVAVATTWANGPCAFLLARIEAPAHQLRQRILTAIGVFVATMFVAVAVAAETVGRVRRLAAHARASVENDHAAIAPDNKRDELSSLTFVLNDASQVLHERRARIEDLNEALRRFVQLTDEEVSRPLGALEGRLAEMSGQPAPQREDVREALRHAHLLGEQVDNLTAAARLRMLGPSPERSPVDLTALVTRLAARHRPLAEAGGIILDVSLPDHPVVIDADESLVVRAVANVVDNAVRYSLSGCTVKVALGTEPTDRRFRLWVTDNGPGVSEEHFRSLTAIRRFRGDEGRNRRPGAPGLGLAVVREVCDRYGLQLDLKRPGAGGFEVEFSGPLA